MRWCDLLCVLFLQAQAEKLLIEGQSAIESERITENMFLRVV